MNWLKPQGSSRFPLLGLLNWSFQPLDFFDKFFCDLVFVIVQLGEWEMVDKALDRKKVQLLRGLVVY